ncbi:MULTISPECIES: hypothetical protein [unclassified Streptomyces]|uniref:hypothetical protein n=1 Tax=unclassified Streptomyces TaxID=2593676 RepID=UPI000446B656|nr:hypothetical protein [Streptomyces sp. PCS3-D2]WKV70776.1 hypothetical protein AW27_004120 [Streptomyces sp. PCS3-D2]
MSQTEHDPSAYQREQDRRQQERPTGTGSAASSLELLTLLAAGVADLALDQLRQTADRAQGALRRADLRELLTDGVVELRKRGELATRRAGMGSENYLETMARRVAQQGTSEGRPCA